MDPCGDEQPSGTIRVQTEVRGVKFRQNRCNDAQEEGYSRVKRGRLRTAMARGWIRRVLDQILGVID